VSEETLLSTITFKAEQIAGMVDDADQAETYASLECTELYVSRRGSRYTFQDGSVLLVRGMAMRWAQNKAGLRATLPQVERHQ
jgi:hypothetical protein